MWKKQNMSDNHYTDEDLLCHLDGELSKSVRRKVSDHLDVCWLCRTRQEHLENQIRLISSSAQSFGVTLDWLDTARRRLTVFQTEFERGVQDTSQASAFRARPWLFAGFASVVAAALVIGALHIPTVPRLPSPVTVIRNVDHFDARLNAQTVHQIFRLDEFQIEPKGPARRTRLEIWSDAESHRFASKWTRSNGSLKYGQWRTDAKTSLVYSPQPAAAMQGAAGNEVLPAFSTIEPDMDVLESSFMQWLKNRPWKPVASLANLSMWERQGAVMQVQRVSTGVLRLMARQQIEGAQVDFIALIDQADYSLRVQRVRVSRAGRIVEFQLSSELSERPARLSPVVFYADRSVPATKLAPNGVFATMKPIVPTPLDTRKPNAVLYPDTSKLVRRIEAFYVLHQARACRGVPVTVSEEDGGVRVSGQNLPAVAAYFTKIAGVPDVMGALSEIRDSDKQVSNAVDRDGFRQLLFDAEALKTLADNFDRSETRVLPDASIRLLESMVQDHAASLSKALAAMNDPTETRMEQAHSQASGATLANWQSAATAVLKGVRILVTSASSDSAALQAKIRDLMQTVGELTAQSQLELNRGRQSAAMRKSKNEK